MTTRCLKLYAAILAALLCFYPAQSQPDLRPAADSAAALDIPRPDLSNEPPILVLSVVDGDTLNVLVGESIEKIRLVGVDAPETKDPREEVGFYGAEASAFLDNLLKGERVYLLPEPGAAADKYGRRLAHVYRAPDGLWINLELVRQGYAQVYTQPAFESLDLFLTCQGLARKAEKGLWNPDLRAEWETSRRKGTAPPPPIRPVVVAPPQTPAPRPSPEPATPAVQPPADSPATEADRVTVYVTRTGAKYHRAGCSYLSKSSIPISLKEAKGRYGPCSRCGPPS